METNLTSWQRKEKKRKSSKTQLRKNLLNKLANKRKEKSKELRVCKGGGTISDSSYLFKKFKVLKDLQVVEIPDVFFTASLTMLELEPGIYCL